MRILVTGASGFIGGKVVEMLAADVQFNIVATGRSASSIFDHLPNVTYLQWDLSRQINELPCDICIHCAGLADDRATAPQFLVNNVLATENLLQSIRQCRSLIYISSSSVYDFADGKIKTETDAGLENKLSLYGRSKLQAENIISRSGISSVYILRPRAVYGNGDRVLLPRIVDLIKNKTLFVPGSLQVEGSLTHIQNLCEAVHKAVMLQSRGVHIYNIADRQPYLMNTVFRKILFKKCGSRRIIHIPVLIISILIAVNRLTGRNSSLSRQALKYITQHEVLNTVKAMQELHYEGDHHFDEFIGQLIFDNNS